MPNLRDLIALWILRRSRGFDAAWYLQTYVDVAEADLDPYEHYLWRGTFERRLPHPAAQYQDLDLAGRANPALVKSLGPLAKWLVVSPRKVRSRTRYRKLLAALPEMPSGEKATPETVIRIPRLEWHAPMPPDSILRLRTALELPDQGAPKVSVIIPCYNSGPYIADRLRSILWQRWPVFQLVILDDASTDDTRDVLQALQQDWERPLPVHVNDLNSGSPFAQWRSALAHCSGDLIWVAEADDLAHPDFLASLVPLFKNDRVSIAYCNTVSIDRDEHILKADTREWLNLSDRSLWNDSFQVRGFEHAAQYYAVQNCIPNASGVVFRRKSLVEAFARCGHLLPNLRMTGDWLLYVESMRDGDICFSPRALNACRRHATSLSFNLDRHRHLREVLAAQMYVMRNFGNGLSHGAEALGHLKVLSRKLELGELEDAASRDPMLANDLAELRREACLA